MSEKPVLRARALSKSYGSLRALRALDLELGRGEIFGFLGPNGAGKTTTLRLVLGLLRPTSGEVAVLGHDCWRESLAVRRRIGYVPGDVRLYGGLDGAAFLRLMARLRGGDVAAHRRRAEEVAERLELDLSRSVRTYSKGNKQKLGLVQSLMHGPELLVLDEPTSALDPLVQQRVYELLDEARQGGTTVFFSSHVLSEVEKICDRVAIIRAGELLEQRDVSTLADLQLRRVRVRLAQAAGDRSVSPAESLQQELADAGLAARRDGATLELTLRGEVDRLVKILARHTVEQLAVEPLTLEEIFFEHYRN